MTTNTYTLGTAVRCDASFTDLAGAAIDPVLVRFKLRAPNGTTTTYVYGVDAELVRDALGAYHVWVATPQSGEYCYRFESEGSFQVANEEQFEVDESCFAVA